ncbi:uncharacterized protein BO88DRAFT_144659 [Aspergillus vadensis CBS 113365]|uniref:Secreted protein n=1 Tax=Aspergillus vadensis (strain CBS 113365 / IMI 142717 / IBT 24658) TaxID=1448311 RepID=A0A319C8X2_ASPVC|nr:hypothetical protein BO88DRAFT_144659 [Aspergillus vadensis CBS 113365]PYH65182.1 hypothetical protein BO88DRAFT_144659 [Aspergillus vadensis CBS 113365]
MQTRQWVSWLVTATLHPPLLSTMHSSLYVCNCHSSCSPGNAMQMDGKRMGRDGEVGEWVGREWKGSRTTHMLQCMYVCMYVCTLSPLSSVAGSICSWNTARQTDRLGIEVVYSVSSSASHHHPTSSAFVGAQIVRISCTVLLVMGLSHYSALVFKALMCLFTIYVNKSM